MHSDIFDVRYMDTLARADSPLHRLDPRAKLITTLVFIIAVVSFPKYALAELIPFFIFPIVLIAVSGLPAGYLFKKVLLILPLAVLIAVFNPLIDRQTLYYLGPVALSGGWVSFFSIIVRFLLTVTAALVLIASTGFNTVCLGLSKLGLPKPFVVQLLFLYRYLFVLAEEARRMAMARSLRCFSRRPMGVRTFSTLAGQLLLRTLERAERVYLAMLSRGFDGKVRMIRAMKRGRKEMVFAVGWSFVFIVLRFSNLPVQVGMLVTGGR